ncbi:hypothetical protein B0T16DRAFT_452812 [Cercophora newfieldiana]|uniref:Uncharacterized protein n=1 Tax=Cercophora newfieldiana TaxID=92897 RepID=A0AA40CZL8_9PEZI|nr:hypothetical protein B0T16DRAFT_452812 [Cercophora newfieldiana]
MSATAGGTGGDGDPNRNHDQDKRSNPFPCVCADGSLLDRSPKDSDDQKAKPARKQERRLLPPAQLEARREAVRERIRQETKEKVKRMERELEEYKSRQSRDLTIQDLMRRNRELATAVNDLRASVSQPYPAPYLEDSCSLHPDDSSCRWVQLPARPKPSENNQDRAGNTQNRPGKNLPRDPKNDD